MKRKRGDGGRIMEEEKCEETNEDTKEKRKVGGE